MPTYSYACTACEHHFDTVQKFTEPSLTDCPQCSGRLRKLFSSVGIVFKGSGFYHTDSRATPSGSDQSSSNGKSEPGSNGKPKSESKPGSSSDSKSGDSKSGDSKSGGSKSQSSPASSSSASSSATSVAS